MTTAIIDAEYETVDRRRLLDALTRHEPALAALGFLMLALIAPTAFAALVDDRSFQGVGVWLKPLKFELALAVYFLTLAFFARFQPAAVRQRRWYRGFVALVVLCSLAEMVWIGAAAAMGTSSHFNTTPLGVVIYPIMGLAAATLTSFTAVQAWLIARNPDLRLSPVVRESLVLGLALVLPLTLVSAGTMSSFGSHFVGGTGSDAGGLPLLGWARDGGDLRVAHFLATHAMHFIPAAGLVVLAVFGPHARWAVRLLTAAFVGLVAFTFVQALAGRPFLPMIG